MAKRGKDHISAQRAGKIRDRYTCQICGSKKHSEGHHIIDFAFGGAPRKENIIALCQSCHKKVHKGGIDLTVF